MSGNFVQRGDAAIMDKLDRAKLAVKSGADLVIEIPVPYCLSSAEIYAKGAVYLLGALGAVDEISFGSECGNIEQLRETAEIIEKCAITCADDINGLLKMGFYSRFREQTGEQKRKPQAIQATIVIGVRVLLMTTICVSMAAGSRHRQNFYMRQMLTEVPVLIRIVI